MMKFRGSKLVVLGVAASVAMLSGCGGSGTQVENSDRGPGVPKLGKSDQVDKILERGTMKVGVLPEYPWLLTNKDGSDPYRGPSWTLAKLYAKSLDVKLETVQVSNDTKVPLVVSGGVDITIGPLNETPERKEVIDFVTYSQSATCLYGLKTNSKVASIPDFEALKSAKGVRVSFFVGQPYKDWLAAELPDATLKGVGGSGSDAPIEELLAGRADYVPADAVKMPKLTQEYPQIVTIPRECIDSDLQKISTGHGIAKDDPAFADFLREIEKKNEADIRKVERDIIESGPAE